MRRVLAIAAIAVRSAVRSRIVILMMAILLMVIVGLPLTVKDDGTLSGHVQLLIGYALGLAALILSLATVWAGCAAVSVEIQNRQLHLVLTKPVRRIQVWLGKWLGLLFVNAVLLGVCGAGVYAMLRWSTRAELLSPADRQALRSEILTARRNVPAQPVNVDGTARREFERARDQKLIPPEVPESQAWQAIRQSLLTRAFSVPPGGKREWIFDLPPGAGRGRPLLFRFRFSSSQLGFENVTGLWRVGRRDSPTRFEYKAEMPPETPRSFSVPASAVEGSGPLVVEYSNVSESPVTVLFSPADGLELFVYETNFEANFARALLVILAQLAFIAALGVTAGSLFSMPVASFVAFCMLLIVQASGYISAMATQEIIFTSHAVIATEPTFWDAFFQTFFKALSVVVGPLHGPNPLDLLAAGEFITGAMLAHAVLVRAALYGGCLALLGWWILSRREIALPSQ
ncbi:MAG: ABC transporter permease [Verrucomicrobiota bacterium]